MKFKKFCPNLITATEVSIPLHTNAELPKESELIKMSLLVYLGNNFNTLPYVSCYLSPTVADSFIWQEDYFIASRTSNNSHTLRNRLNPRPTKLTYSSRFVDHRSSRSARCVAAANRRHELSPRAAADRRVLPVRSRCNDYTKTGGRSQQLHIHNYARLCR